MLLISGSFDTLTSLAGAKAARRRRSSCIGRLGWRGAEAKPTLTNRLLTNLDLASGPVVKSLRLGVKVRENNEQERQQQYRHVG